MSVLRQPHRRCSRSAAARAIFIAARSLARAMRKSVHVHYGRAMFRRLREPASTPTDMAVALGLAAVRAEVPWVGFHTFRHTCASLLFASGKNVKQVQVWLGHADPGFTVRTYIHLMDDGLGDAGFLDEL